MGYILLMCQKRDIHQNPHMSNDGNLGARTIKPKFFQGFSSHEQANGRLSPPFLPYVVMG